MGGNSPLVMMTLDTIKLTLENYFVDRKDSSEAVFFGVEKRNKKIILFYRDKNKRGTVNSTESEDGFTFVDSKKAYKMTQKPNEFPNAQLVPGKFHKDSKYLYFGDRSINCAHTVDGVWQKRERPLVITSYPLEVGAVFERKQGFLLLYYQKTVEAGVTYYSAFTALFDKQNPEELLWKTSEPIWRHKDVWPSTNAEPLGAVLHHEQIIAYWLVNGKMLMGVVLSGFKFDPQSIQKGKLKLRKHLDNPIIMPNPENEWEAFNTFNPAAVYAGDKVHILYRAQGFDYISSVGYASSNDGINIDTRLPYPIYQPEMEFENNKTGSVNPDLMSGGGYGGCEDPRVTLLGDRVYITYVAFNGWSSIRLALSSILLDDFLNQRWNWTKPVLLSRPGIIDKSGCLLPEKINGKYVFFHRVFPDILIDYVDDLGFEGKDSYLKNQYRIPVRKDKWDSRKIGAGAPPLKTKDGWLLIYYGVDDRDASKYHIGAMLLDLKDPAKVLYRCDEPILQPTEDYENRGFKPGIAYPCGAVIMKNKLLVYYGGADTVVCVAEAPLETFLTELKSNKPIHLTPVIIREIQYPR